jgi:hypothetical protein
MIFTVNLMKDGLFHLFAFDSRHIHVLKGPSAGVLVNHFRFLYPHAKSLHPDRYAAEVAVLVRQRRERKLEMFHVKHG